MATLTLSMAEARIAELEAKLANKAKVSFKVSPAGAISFYGLGRFPVTLYVSQFEALVAIVPAVQAWIKTNPTSDYSKHEKYAAKGVVSLALKD